MTLARHLDAHLHAEPAALEALGRDDWRRRAGADRPPLVLFGAGHLGRKVRAALAGSGFPVLAFADNDPGKQGTVLDGLPVLAPAQAAERHGDSACFLVTIWRAEGEPHRFLATEARLRELGARHVAHFAHLARVRPDGLLPHYALDRPEPMLAARDEVRAALDLFDEPRSRELFLGHALWRLTLDFGLLPEPDPGEIYFPAGLVRPGPGQVLVDAGGFDGDTCRRMLELWGEDARRIHAFEPDPGNRRRFRDWLDTSPHRDRVRLHPLALGARAGTLAFAASGTLDAAASAAGQATVACAALDQVLADDPPDFIKMDIEGAERDALLGARELLRRGPELAVCLYHVPDHLWSIPLLLRQHLPGHRLRLRSHGTDGWELVLYATRA
jgi:FkbM family methyltransferase